MNEYESEIEVKSARDPEPANFSKDLEKLIPRRVRDGWKLVIGEATAPDEKSRHMATVAQKDLRAAGLAGVTARADRRGCRPCPTNPQNCHICDLVVRDAQGDELEVNGVGVVLQAVIRDLNAAP